jgi:hypothetical protein
MCTTTVFFTLIAQMQHGGPDRVLHIVRVRANGHHIINKITASAHTAMPQRNDRPTQPEKFYQAKQAPPQLTIRPQPAME